MFDNCKMELLITSIRRILTNFKNIMNEIFITKYYIIMGWN